jgi:hypothetical protein
MATAKKTPARQRPAKKVRARRSFEADVAAGAVPEGAVFDADDPVVRANPAEFEPVQ